METSVQATRRHFIAAGAAVVGATFAAAPAIAAEEGPDPATLEMPPTTPKGDMLYRPLGSTGQEVSLIGLGGFHIGKQKDEQESIRLIRSAVDRGITFLDNCWDYNNGQSEIRMGKALRDGYREKIFLMTKIDGRTKKAAAQQIDESLHRLQADHLDLCQFHEIIRMEDPDRIFAEGGALEAALEAKKAGKVRHIGFTGHKDPLVHLRMLQVAAEHQFHFDTAQMPVNVMDANFRSFQRDVLPVLVKQKIGPLAMKTFGDHFILDEVLKQGIAKPVELLHYSMSLPVSVVITGIDKPEILDQAIEAARTFKPMTREQMAALRDKTRPIALTGTTEKFKTTAHFDGTAHNPGWLG
jgi:aryl-alcohol dehydrogenase-like predicted oxidoreductase